MRKALVAMMLYLVVFGFLALLSLYGYLHRSTIIDVGMPVQFTNLLILVLSIGGMVKSVWHIHRVRL